MDRQLYLTTKKDWKLIIVGATIIAAAILQILSEKIFKPEQLFLFAALFLIYYGVMPEYINFDAAGSGTVNSKVWIHLAYRHYHCEGLAKAKTIIVRKANRWGDVKVDSRIILFNDGFELPLPDDEQIPEKIVGWFKEVYDISLPVTDEYLEQASLLG